MINYPGLGQPHNSGSTQVVGDQHPLARFPQPVVAGRTCGPSKRPFVCLTSISRKQFSEHDRGNGGISPLHLATALWSSFLSSVNQGEQTLKLGNAFLYVGWHMLLSGAGFLVRDMLLGLLYYDTC